MSSIDRINNLKTPPDPLTLTLQQARALHLAAQGLLSKPKIKATKTSVLAAIEQMCLLQIDTIHVVARSPYFVLFSRLGNYQPRWLDEALAEGAVFEGWAHEACFIPGADYHLHHSNRVNRARHWAFRHAQRMHAEHQDSMDRLLSYIRQNGPVKASDFELKTPSTPTGWWGWKDEKRWLEAWFALGELMVARRENFHRVYDLTERVIGQKSPNRATHTALSIQEINRQFILKAVRALGIAQSSWIADYFRTGKKHKDNELDWLVEEGELFRVAVQGWNVPGYIHRDYLSFAKKAMAGQLRATYTTLLSPFDPVVWDRRRASALFEFDYTIECYTPALKRRYGYFVLPILHCGQLIGRLDAKAHRTDGLFEIKAIFLEEKTKISEKLTRAVAQAIQSCANWHQTPKVIVRCSESKSFVRDLQNFLMP